MPRPGRSKPGRFWDGVSLPGSPKTATGRTAMALTCDRPFRTDVHAVGGSPSSNGGPRRQAWSVAPSGRGDDGTAIGCPAVPADGWRDPHAGRPDGAGGAGHHRPPGRGGLGASDGPRPARRAASGASSSTSRSADPRRWCSCPTCPSILPRCSWCPTRSWRPSPRPPTSSAAASVRSASGLDPRRVRSTRARAARLGLGRELPLHGDLDTQSLRGVLGFLRRAR